MTYICQVDTKAALWQFAGSIKRPNGVASKIGRVFMTVPHRCANTAEKLRGTKVLVPTPGRLRPTPGQRPSWVLDAGGGRPFRCQGPGVLPPEKFSKTQMLNPAFRWLLLLDFLLSENYGQEVGGGTNDTMLVPNLKVGRTSLARSLQLLRLWSLKTSIKVSWNLHSIDNMMGPRRLDICTKSLAVAKRPCDCGMGQFWPKYNC